ncbi:MAG: arginine--tRNA ligase [Anaerolineae bacterium]|nr:arginine--tRNA ligase [Anaerolineae bacterium]
MNLLPSQFERLIRAAIQAAQAAGDLPDFDLPESIPVQRSTKPDMADYASPAAMQLAKSAGRKPREIADAIARHLPPADFLGGVEVAGPGFLNFRLSEDWLLAQIETIIAAGETVFTLDIGQGKRAQVECVSANPTGPLTVGHTRNGIIGSAMANILGALGFAVEMEYYFNNAGRQMRVLGQSLQARYLQALGQDVPLPEDGYQGDYMIEIAQGLVEQYDDALLDESWERFKLEAERAMFAWITRSLDRISIRFDVHFNENSLYEDNSVWNTLDALRAAGCVYESVIREGADEDERAKYPPDAKEAVWFRSTSYGDTEDRVLVKSTGEPTYVLPDIAYHQNKLDRGFDYLVNVLGADHIIEAQTVARGLNALGYDSGKIHVILYQFVTLFEGGEQKKMSTRRGEFVTQDELVDDVGADVVRYFILARSPNSHLEFDLDLARQQANENPVYYIQNAHVRCAGIFRQVDERGGGLDDSGADLSLLGDRERAFVRKMLEVPEILAQCYDDAEPHKLAFFALDLARQFHPLYDAVRVLHTDVPADVARARLRLYRAAQIVFKRVLTLMGMSAPEIM